MHTFRAARHSVPRVFKRYHSFDLRRFVGYFGPATRDGRLLLYTPPAELYSSRPSKLPSSRITPYPVHHGAGSHSSARPPWSRSTPCLLHSRTTAHVSPPPLRFATATMERAGLLLPATITTTTLSSQTANRVLVRTPAWRFLRAQRTSVLPPMRRRCFSSLRFYCNQNTALRDNSPPQFIRSVN
jgi:hypothetical protein